MELAVTVTDASLLYTFGEVTTASFGVVGTRGVVARDYAGVTGVHVDRQRHIYE